METFKTSLTSVDDCTLSFGVLVPTGKGLCTEVQEKVGLR